MKAIFGVLTSIIIGLIVLVLMFIYFGGTRSDLTNLEDSQACRQSLQLNARARIDEYSFSNNIKCPTLNIKADSDEKETIFAALAMSMANTWSEFLEGKMEVFDTKTQDYCVFRRVIEFKEPGRYDGFFNYLLQNNPPGMDMSYFKYLTNVDVTQGQTAVSNNPNLKSDVIDTSTPYAAIFVLAKKDKFSKAEGAVSGSKYGAMIAVAGVATIGILTGGIGLIPTAGLIVSGTIAGGTTGYLMGSDYAADWKAAMLLVPYTQETLKSLDCTELPVKLTPGVSASG